MGEYWFPVNLTRKQFIHPHDLGCGLKLAEWTYPGSPVLEAVSRWNKEDSIGILSDYDGWVPVTACESGPPPYDSMRDEYEVVTTGDGADNAELVSKLIDAAAPRVPYQDWHKEWAAIRGNRTSGH